ncbi:phage tail tape measure protein [Porphyrobacter sp. YT40]|uniref:phage tail tape measure protein n=1 Tax=Porphyrobacter sp. YT40 TaxID=2547601 RepID=UPI00114326A4|nr:phage tail tape measure protein [Porphyrobacter sp. YT40]QDH33992.1 phage tail tape measure protein [Porphyrobacter sp. YT40]
MSNKLTLLVNFLGVDKMSGALRNIIGLGNKGSASLGALRGEGRKLEAQLREVRRQMEGASGNITELVNRERELERAIRDNQNALEGRREELRRQAAMNEQLARADAIQQKGRDNMVQGAALAAPLILAVKAAGDFSSGMVDIQQKAALTNAETEKLGKTIIGIANNASLMPEDIRSGLDLLLAKGMGLDAATNAIGPASRLATAYKVELPDAADAAFASINNLKVASSEAAVVFDTLAAAGNEGGFEVRDMAKHFPALTAQMAALGERGVPAVADLSAALQVAMNTAGNADEAGNNIKNLLGKINSPGTINAFKKNFGIDLPAAMQKLQSEGYSAMESIAMITQQATGGDMKKLAFAFEDTQARMGLLALIQNLDEYRRVREAAMNSGGTVDAAFDQRVLGDATVSWRAFMGSVSGLAVTLGTTLLPVMTTTISYINSAMQSVSAWAQANPEAASTIVKLVAAIAAFKIGLGAVQFAIGGVMRPIAMMTPLVMKYAGSWSNAFAMMRFGVMALARGVMSAGMMMMANPIVALIVAIVAALALAGYLIYTHWDTIKAAFLAGWNYVTDLLSGAASWMSNIGKQMMDGLLLAINPMALGKKLIDMAKNGIEAFKNYLGIQSPSRVFMGLGEDTAAGMQLGLQKGERGVLGAAGRMATGMVAASSLAAAPAMAGAGTAGAGGGGMTVTINIQQQPGEDATALAERVRIELERMAGQAARSSYSDG